jgi:hypothetical protein
VNNFLVLHLNNLKIVTKKITFFMAFILQPHGFRRSGLSHHWLSPTYDHALTLTEQFLSLFFLLLITATTWQSRVLLDTLGRTHDSLFNAAQVYG